MANITHPKSDNIPDADLAREQEIVWVYDQHRFPFVRESFAPQSSARWPRRCQDDRVIVAYGISRKRSGAKHFRQFYVMRRDGEGKFGLPSQAVDTLTVEIGVPGRKTARCHETMTAKEKRHIAKIFREKNNPKKTKRAKKKT